MSVLDTPLCALTGQKYPIIQTGMGWVAGPRLVAASCEAGAMGILASATMSAAELARAIDDVRDRDAPFGVNLRTDAEDIDERVQRMIDAGATVASFATAPDPKLVARCKEAGLVVIPTVGAVRHAEKVKGWGADAVLAQGAEGGGHTGTVPTSLLVPQIVDAVDIPVIAAGGYFDGRGLVAALAYGAVGIAMGTRFLLTKESRVPDSIKSRYLRTTVAGTVVTPHVDGVPQRVVRTEFIDRLEKENRARRLARALRSGHQFRMETGATLTGLAKEARSLHKERTWSQVVLAACAPMMTKHALVDGDPDAGVLPTGQVVGLIEGDSADDLPSVEEVVRSIIDGVDATLRRLSD